MAHENFGHEHIFMLEDAELGQLCFTFGFAPCSRDRNPHALPWIESHEHFDQTIDGEAAEISIAHAGKIRSGERGQLAL